MEPIATIVGIDPGTTTGVAVLSLEGELVAWSSKKEFSRSQVSEFIISHGKPVLIATDVSPAPSFAQKISSTFGAQLYEPNEDLGQAEKEAIASDYDTEAMDTHAKDALAAAVKAFRHHHDLIQKVLRTADERDIEEIDSLLEDALQGTLSISQLIDRIEEEEEHREEEEDQQETIDWKKAAKRYRERLESKDKEIERLREYKDSLETDLEEKEEEVKELQEETKQEAMKDEEVQRWRQKSKNYEKTNQDLRNTIRNLKNTNERYRKALRYIYAGESLFKICETADELQEIDRSTAFVRKNLRAEPSESLKLVIVEKEEDREYYEEKGLKAVNYPDLKGLKLGGFYVVDQKEVMEQATDESDNFLDWLEGYRGRK